MKITPELQIEHTMRMLSRNNIKSPEEQKLGEGGDDKQVIKLMWPYVKLTNFLNKEYWKCISLFNMSSVFTV